MHLGNSNHKVLPDGWITLPLSELFFNPTNDIVDGPFGSNLKTSDYTDSGVPILRVQNIERNQFINKNIQFISRDKADELSRHSYKAGDIVLTKLGNPLGKACVVPDTFEDGIIVADLVRLRLEHDLVNKKFLVYAVNGPFISNQLKENTKGTTRPRVTLGHIRNLQVNLPPRNEQDRIIDKVEELFSELDKGIEYLKTAQEQLKVYRQSVLKAAFEGRLTEEWREAHTDQLETADQLLERIQQERENLYQQKLNEWEEAVKAWEENGKESRKPSKPSMPKEVSSLTEEELAELPILPDGWCWVKPEAVSSPEKYSIGIGPFGSNLKVSDYRESGAPLIFVRNITNNDFNLDLKYISEEKLLELQAHTVQPSDIVITKMGDPPGDVAIYPEDRPIAVLTADCLKFRVWSDFVEIKYFRYCIESNLIKKQLGVITKGVAQKKISTERFKTLCFPLPARTEQREIVEEIERKFVSTSELQSEVDRDLTRSKILRQSIIKKAFSGRLVPQNPNDEPASSLLERIRAERQAALKPTRKPSTSEKKPRKKEVMNLISVLESANDWLSAQDAFRECGIADGAETKVIEKLYLELRDLEKDSRIEVERRGDEDWLRIRSGDKS